MKTIEKPKHDKSYRVLNKESPKIDEPKKFIVISIRENVCVNTANKVSEIVFNKRYTKDAWDSNEQLVFGIFTKDIAQTKVEMANHYVEKYMGGCSCQSMLKFLAVSE